VRNSIGQRGEAIFQVLLTKFHGRNKPIFRPQFLGDKRLALLPAPTYIIGIDEINETGYIISANGQYRKSLRSLSTQFPINKNTQDTLWMEVQNYWNRFGTLRITSKFIDPAWK
jgi:hypothetical protein